VQDDWHSLECFASLTNFFGPNQRRLSPIKTCDRAAKILTQTKVSAFVAEDIQCIAGHGAVPFGQAQQPGLADYADGVDTLEFLLGEI